MPRGDVAFVFLETTQRGRTGDHEEDENWVKRKGIQKRRKRREEGNKKIETVYGKKQQEGKKRRKKTYQRKETSNEQTQGKKKLDEKWKLKMKNGNGKADKNERSGNESKKWR